MSILVTNGSKYSDEQRTQAAIHYAVTGSLVKTEQATGIPDSTIGTWKKQDWWVDLVGSVRNEKGEEHRAMYSQIVDKAQRITLEKLPDASAAQANLIACQATDKVKLHDGMPTSITGSIDNRALAEQCKELSRTMRDHRVVSTQPQNKSKTDAEDN